MKYLIERNDKTMVVDVPEGATFETEWVEVATKEGKTNLLAVHFRNGPVKLASFAMVTAFYPESMEPRKQEFI